MYANKTHKNGFVNDCKYDDKVDEMPKSSVPIKPVPLNEDFVCETTPQIFIPIYIQLCYLRATKCLNDRAHRDPGFLKSVNKDHHALLQHLREHKVPVDTI